MEIDHVFASGAVVGRATTHSWGRPAPRCARSDGRPHSCVVARPTTAPDAKTWSIPTSNYADYENDFWIVVWQRVHTNVYVLCFYILFRKILPIFVEASLLQRHWWNAENHRWLKSQITFNDYETITKWNKADCIIMAFLPSRNIPFQMHVYLRVYVLSFVMSFEK